MTTLELNKYINVLKKCILFDGIDLDRYNHMINCLEPVIKHYKAGSTIAIEGEICPGICIVLSGEVMVYKTLPTGECNIMDVITPGKIFGEVSTFTKNKNWPSSVSARVNSEIMIIRADKFVQQCANQCFAHRKLTENMLIIISEKVVILNRKMSYLMQKPLRNKICRYLFEQQQQNRSNTFLIPFSRDELAEFLNVARPSLSRELGKMRDEGIIDFHRSTIKILKPEVIIECACNT